MGEKITLVAILPDGTQYFEEINAQPVIDFKIVAEKAVRNAKLTTPRNNPSSIQVEVYIIEIKGGKMCRRLLGNTDIRPPLARMTKDDYDIALANILKELPEEFRSYVATEAWDRGHSCGYEEVILMADNIVDALKPAIRDYADRLRQEH